MDAFTFRAPEVGDLVIKQESQKAIGFKVYPGALLLVDFFQRELLGPAPSGRCPGLHPGARVLEVGAGVCGIPALFLALQGRHVVATDAPDVVPLLAANIGANAPPERMDAAGGSCSAAPLWWGNSDHTAALLAAHGPLDAIVAADVVYHEHLIDPLLQALLALTDSAGRATPPPPIILSYVQRFKRAKAFFKKARKWFDVTAYAYRGGEAGWVAVEAGREDAEEARGGSGSSNTIPEACIDYDALCWNHPAAGSAAAREAVVLTPASADYRTYLRDLAATAEAHKASNSSSNSKPSGGEGDEAKPAPKWHAVDSDTDPEEEAAAAAAVGHGLFTATAAEDVFEERAAAAHGDEDEEMSSGGAGALPGRSDPLAPYRAAARALGVRLADPMKGYVYVLTRRR